VCVRWASSLAASAQLDVEDGFAMESHVLCQAARLNSGVGEPCTQPGMPLDPSFNHGFMAALRASAWTSRPTARDRPRRVTQCVLTVPKVPAPRLVSQVALFIFHGASRHNQAGVAKPSPAVAKLTALVKRVAPKLTARDRTKQRVNPTAVAPAAYPPKDSQGDSEEARVTATTHDHLVLQSCTARDFDELDLEDEDGAVHPMPPVGISTAQGQICLDN
jgi:hypothetical protein